MLDFQVQKPSPNFLAGRERRRVLVVVLIVGLTIIALHHLFAASQPQRAIDDMGGSSAQVDTRVQPPAAADEPLDVFVSKPAAAPVPDASGKFFPGVSADILQTIQDDTYFRSREHQAWFHLLGILAAAAPGQIDGASTGEVAFVQLFEQPQHYRGQLVTVRGTVRRAEQEQAPTNQQGIASYTKLWIQPAGGPNHPLLVFCLDLPPEFPVGDGLSEEVEVTGFFFKRWVYESRDGIRSTPVLLAKVPHWEQAGPAADGGFTLTLGRARIPLTWIVGSTVALSVAAVLLLAYLGNRSRQPLLERAPPAPGSLAEVPTPVDPRVALKRLEEGHS